MYKDQKGCGGRKSMLRDFPLRDYLRLYKGEVVRVTVMDTDRVLPLSLSRVSTFFMLLRVLSGCILLIGHSALLP